MRTRPIPSPSRLPPLLPRWRSLAVLLAASGLLGCPSPGSHRGDLPALTPGRLLQGRFAGGATHRYPVHLAAGQFLRVVVAEEGVDVAVRLRDPQGREVVHVDGPNQPHEDEDLAAIAERAGLYHLEVSAGGKEARGSYRILRVELRPAGEAERARARAARLTQEAVELILRQDEASLRRQIAKREEALAIWRRLGERGHEAAALFQMGTARFELKELAPGAMNLAQAAALWREVGAKVNQADALYWLGIVERALERREEALRDYKEALALLDETGGDPLFKARILNNLGGVYTDLSATHEALDCYRQSLALAGAKGPSAAVLNNIGLLYQSLGEEEKALDSFKQALKIDDAQGDRAAMAKTYNNMGLAQQQLADTEAARDSFTRAVQLAIKIEDRKTQAHATANLGYLELDLHRPDRAREWCRQALELATGDPEIESSARTALGAAYRELGDLSQAGAQLDLALGISRKRGDAVHEANVQLNLARVARARGDSGGAVAQIGRALGLVESLRTRVASPDLRASFLASVQSYYEFDIDIRMSLHEDAAALSTSERARARSFLDLLNSAGTSLRQGIPPRLLERERQASDAVSLAERRRARVSADPRSRPRAVAAAVRDRDAAIEEFQRVEEDVRASSPRYASLTQPLALPEIQKLLDDKTLLLEFALGEKRSYLWAVTPAEIRSYTLPGRDDIEKVARRFYAEVTLRSRDSHADAAALARADAAAAAAARELSRMVLAPAAGLLADRRLLVVSDGALQYVPFAALPDPAAAAAYLVERHEILSLPSASVLSVLRRQLAQRPPPEKRLAVLADPVFQPTDERLAGERSEVLNLVQSGLGPRPRTVEPRGSGKDRDCSSQRFRRLRFSGTEADDIARLLPRQNVREALGFEASLPFVESGALSGFGWIHFATHGCIDDRHPELSGLVLSLVDAQGHPQDGILWLKDIYNLKLNADLVVLSACQTALGKEIRGEGLIGLTRGFLYAGSARVLASLWKVDDRATAQLMIRFYGGMLGKQPLSAAAALRQAQLALAREPGWSSPYYWAAFSLQGEWR